MKTTTKTFLALALTVTLGFQAKAFNNPVSSNTSNIEIHDSLAKNEQSNKVVYFVAESMPEFIGGATALNRYLKNNMDYPEYVRKQEIEDKVIVMFTVNADGSVDNIVAATGKNDILKKEAIKTIKEMPSWTPGTINNQKVAVRMAIPISFVLK
jgi:protein TonB